MADQDSGGSLWRSLRRHPAAQAAAVYVGASWALIEGADIFFPSFGFTPDAIRWLGGILAVGFVIVVGSVWRAAARESRDAVDIPEPQGDPDASTPIRRRRRRFAYTAALGLLLLGGIFWWARPRILGAVAPAAEVIAVMPFHTSGPGVELLAEGMVDLLAPNLDAVGGIRTVDARTVLHHWRQRALGGSLDLEGALAVGREVDAGSILWGTATAAGSELRLTAELFTVKGHELARAQADGPADSVLALVDSLSLELLRKIWVAREPVPHLRVSAITTGSLDAIRNYLRGEQHYRLSRWDSALVSFRAAVTADSTFALAHYRLAEAYGWTTGFGTARSLEHGEAAARFAERLPPRERSLVTAYSLFGEGDVAALDTLADYVQRYSDDVEGWYLLGDVRFHARPIRAFSLEELYSPFDRVLELDPSLAPAMLHPLDLGLRFNDRAAYNRYLDALRSVAPPQAEPYALAGVALWGSGDSANVAFTRIAQLRPTLLGIIYTGMLHSPAGTPDDLLRRFESNLRVAREAGSLPPAFTSGPNVLIGRAFLLVGLGRLAEAKPFFDTLRVIDPQGTGNAVLAPIFAGLADSTYAPDLLASLSRPDPDPAVQQLLDSQLMAYALSRGDDSTARRFAERGLAAERSFAAELTAGLLTAGIGWADILAGDTLGGIEKMKSGLDQAGFSVNAIAAGQPLRFQLAATLAAFPDTRAEGIRRLRYGTWFADTQYAALRFYLLGQALEASGDLAAAADAYSQFIRLWESADPHLQPRVETARRALERLGREGAG